MNKLQTNMNDTGHDQARSTVWTRQKEDELLQFVDNASQFGSQQAALMQFFALQDNEEPWVSTTIGA